MREEQQQFMQLMGHLPARLTAEQTAWVLNCQPHDITALMGARLLKPLGNPAQNAIKFFSTAQVLELSRDQNWLVRMTVVINQHWHRQNARKRVLAAGSGGEGVDTLAG